MRAIREGLFNWILNPSVIFSNLLGANFTVDTTVYKADHTAHTTDNITI